MWILFVLVSLVNAQLTCSNCRIIAHSAELYLTDPDILDVLQQYGTLFCSVPTAPSYCESIVSEIVSEFVNSARERYINADWVCASIGACSYPLFRELDFFLWAREKLKDKPRNKNPSGSVSQTLKFAQLTGLHIDNSYKAGTSILCDEPPCCQRGNTEPLAGELGDYNCDLPFSTFTKALDFLKEQSLDFIIWTGGTAPHRYDMSGNDKIKLIEEITEEFLKEFDADTVPVFPMYGGIDCFPPSQLNFNDNRLSRQLADTWKPWLGSDSSQLSDFDTYSTKVKNSDLRIVTLNTLACDYFNVNIMSNSTDPGDQLEILEATLLEAEKNEESVYIIGHMPPNSPNCLGSWGKHYSVLVDRFQNTIKGQFFGYSSDDQIAYNREHLGNSATGTMFIAPPLSPYKNRNPSIRVYEYDPDTFEVVTYKQYRLDLQKTDPEFEFAYDFKDYYFSKPFPSNVKTIATEIESDELIAVKYLNQKFTGGLDTPFSCDQQCRIDTHCEIKTDNSEDLRDCQNVSKTILYAFVDFFYGRWVIKEPK